MGFSKEIFRSDHPSGNKMVIFTLKRLPIKRGKGVESIQESVATEITLRRKKYFLLPFTGLQTKAVNSLICFKKASKTLLIILKI